MKRHLGYCQGTLRAGRKVKQVAGRVKGGCFRWSLRNGLSGCEAGSETKGSKGLSHTCGENSDCGWEQLTCSENGQEPAWLERGQCEAEEMRSGRSVGPVSGCLGACGTLDSIQ